MTALRSLAAFGLLACSVSLAPADALPPAEAVAKMQVAEGFTVRVAEQTGLPENLRQPPNHESACSPAAAKRIPPGRSALTSVLDPLDVERLPSRSTVPPRALPAAVCFQNIACPQSIALESEPPFPPLTTSNH